MIREFFLNLNFVCVYVHICVHVCACTYDFLFSVLHVLGSDQQVFMASTSHHLIPL